MTVDVMVNSLDDIFLDDIDEIMEDTMVQLFVVHPKDKASLELVQEHANEHNALFYAAPLSLKDESDDNCVAYQVDDLSLLKSTLDKPIFIDAALLDETIQARLIEHEHRGIIVGARQSYNNLSKFSAAISSDNVEVFDKASLEITPMEKLVFHSSYPSNDFDTIMTNAKKVSDVMFRPEQSIIANATKTALILFGFKK